MGGVQPRRPTFPARIMAGLGALAVHLVVLVLVLVPSHPQSLRPEDGNALKLFVPAAPEAPSPEAKPLPEHHRAIRQAAPRPISVPPNSTGAAAAQATSPAPALSQPLPATTAAVTESSLQSHHSAKPPERPEEARQAYARLLWRHIAQHRPAGISLSGTTTISFRLDAQGNLLSVHISQSSGNMLLDKLASRTVFRSAPFPPPPIELAPIELAGEPLSFAIPFSFR